MADPIELAAPHSIQDDGSDRRWAAHASVAVVHVGQSALVLSAGNLNHLIVITPSSSGLMPGGICIPARSEFDPVRFSVMKAHQRQGQVSLSSWNRRQTAIEHVDLQVQPQKIDRAAIHQLRAQLDRSQAVDLVPTLMDPRPIRLLADELVLALRRPQDAGTLAGVLEQLVGAGPGTTPTGDDIIVGVLAGLCMRGDTEEFSTLALALPPFFARTTIAARHYLLAATTARFGAHIHDLVQAITGERSAITAFTRATGWGSTSGLDVLSGLIAAVSDNQCEFMAERRQFDQHRWPNRHWSSGHHRQEGLEKSA